MFSQLIILESKMAAIMNSEELYNDKRMHEYVPP